MLELYYQDIAQPANHNKLLQFCTQLLKLCGVGDDSELTLLLTNNDIIAKLNLTYRNKNEATDVLSFGNEKNEGLLADWPLNSGYLGDIAISVEKVAENAEYFKVSYDEELKRLIIHGLLHLQGYNHQTNNFNEPMLLKQEDLLRQLKVIG
ncbi:MAG: rRNA maturation RNase YbeY [Spirochaetaceae bacterium]|nr:rRNA maturation RNase YbeY [Spirochaetaceae bacterium]